jgi:very-short-patch-repair endonuclease
MRRCRLPRHQVALALAAGLLLAPRRGLVVLPELPDDHLAVPTLGGVLSCASAARAHGLELINDPAELHLTVPRGTRVRGQARGVVHRRDVVSTGLATDLARTAADCARCLPSVEALVVVESALRRGVRVEEIEHHLWGRGCGSALSAVRRADRRSGSSGETVARVTLQEAGLDVEPQVFVSGVGWVDLLVEARVVVEIDGFSYHSDRTQFAKDRRRDARLTAMGYLVVRFTWFDAVRWPDYVVSTVRQLLAVAS